MTEEQIDRVKQLIEEFRIFNDVGFINMVDWAVSEAPGTEYDKLTQAINNPCGTAACIAGKAGLMQVFRDQGFKWCFRNDGFSIEPQEFFGEETYNCVFIGTWCSEHVHTPTHAVLVLEDFLRQWDQALNDGKVANFNHYWEPEASVVKMIYESRPDVKEFPASQITMISYEDGLGYWEM